MIHYIFFEDKNQTLVRKLGGVPPIIHLLMQSQDSVIAAAASALAALTAGNRMYYVFVLSLLFPVHIVL
jgi:hypothetical protein